MFCLCSIPIRFFYTCHDGYSLDGKWENASNASSTNMRFASACTLDGYFSVLENPCVPVSCGAAPVVGLATSIAWVSSSVSGDASPVGLDVVGLARLSAVSLVSGEVVHYVCHHGHTVDGNAKSSASFSATCSSNGTFVPEPPASCQPVVCPLLAPTGSQVLLMIIPAQLKCNLFQCQTRWFRF